MAVVAVSLSLLFGFSALSVDLWRLYLVRNQMQVAADAAALAAATSLLKINSGSISAAKNLATTILQNNQFVNGTNNTTITLNIPPGANPNGTSPTYANDSNYARVSISQNVTPFFAQFLGISSVPVKASAVGGPQPLSTCVLALATSGSGCFYKTGSGALTISQGSLCVNSNHSTALINNGSGKITVGQCNISGGYSGSINGSVSTYTSPTADPFASLTLPAAPTSWNYYNYSTSWGSSTLYPGVYLGGITISGYASVNFQPGVYTLYGGGLSIGTYGTVSGSGVCFYNTGTNNIFSSSQYGDIQISNYGTVSLSAPTSGSYLGMLCLQDPNNTQTVSLTANSSSTLAGNIYCPTAGVSFNCAGNISKPVGAIVCKTYSHSGGGSMSMGTNYGLAGYAKLYN